MTTYMGKLQGKVWLKVLVEARPNGPWEYGQLVKADLLRDGMRAWLAKHYPAWIEAHYSSKEYNGTLYPELWGAY